MQDNVNRDKIGNLTISEEVIATIASLAASEVSGVASLVPNASTIKTFFRKNPVAKAVKVDLNDNIAVIDIYIKLKYGAKIPAVADAVQRNVKESVQNMTNIAVTKVNVYIAGILFDDIDAR